MRKNIAFTPLMALIASGAGMAAYGQDTTSAVLAGRVTDQQGRPMQGVRVLIESPALLGTRQAATDANGNFRVQLLPNGTFTITYAMDGYITRRQTLRLVAGQTGNGSASLTPISTESVEVVIEGERVAQVDKTDTVVQTVFDVNFLEKVAGRNGLNAAGLLTPGINVTNLATNRSQGQGGLRIRGGTTGSTKFLVDGGNVTDAGAGYFLPVSPIVNDLVESIAVIQSPINARYGNSDGGLVTMVTSRGSNTFTGTFRANFRRSYWNAVSPYGTYGSRDTDWPGGVQPAPTSISTDDVSGKDYEVTVQGPIWKDRITFAYGARLAPNTRSSTILSGRWLRQGDMTNNFQANSKVGTYYQVTPESAAISGGNVGDVIRRPEMYLYNSTGLADQTAQYGGGIRDNFDTERFNQFTVFAQITPEHQLEYKYSQSDEDYTMQDFGHADNAPWAVQGTYGYNWTLGYKGIIGASGVIDARYGKQFLHWYFGDGVTREQHPVRTSYLASRIPLAGPWRQYWNQTGGRIEGSTNPDDYLMNGYLAALAGTDWQLYNLTQAEYNADPGAHYNPANGLIGLWGENFNYFTGGYGGNTSFTLNYQHYLSTSMGTHMLDGGLQYEWRPTYKSTHPQFGYRFYAMGRIAKDLTQADIYNPYGTAAPAEMYRGKFIVYNAMDAYYSDIDPISLQQWNMRDAKILADANANVARGMNRDILPRYTLRDGGVEGKAQTLTQSYYINDLWSINDNHSIQGGLRVDTFSYEDPVETFIKYTQPTLRFEYKWDIHGDQSRMFNVSWGQFHAALPLGTYTALTPRRGDNETEYLWGAGTVKPYLVDLEGAGGVYDLSMYREVRKTVSATGNRAVDPGFRAPISTELSAGLRRSYANGGSWRMSFSYRTWANEYEWRPGDIIEVPGDGRETIVRVLQNVGGFERTYTGLEFEWDLPLFKRINFGGSYTYSRLMSNAPARMDQPGTVDTMENCILDWYWDEVFGGRGNWRPVMIMDPEHYFKWYVLFDLSRGKFSSSLAFQGTYTSSDWRRDSYTYNYGYPYDLYPQFFGGPAGGAGDSNRVAEHGVTVGSVIGIFGGSTVSVPFSTYATNQNDTWGCTARYVLAVPLVSKLTWLLNLTISDPFNHRGLSGGNFSGVGGAGTAIVPNYLPGPSPIAANNIYRGVWKPDGGDFNGQYMARQGGRAFGVRTGLKF